MKKRTESRRTFLKKAAFAAPMVLSAQAVARGAGYFSPNEKVKIGLIGCGNRCRDVVSSGMEYPEFQMVAVADCFEPQTQSILKHYKANWNAYTDFRKMIEKEKLDGVLIETTTHARAWITVLALQMGVDAYIEKPMCLTIEEGQAMVAAAQRNKCVTQIGTQQRSIPLNNYACDLIQQGAIGKVKVVLAPNFIGSDPWVDQPAQPCPRAAPRAGGTSGPTRHRCDPTIRPSIAVGVDGGTTTPADVALASPVGVHTPTTKCNAPLGTSETGPVEILLEEPVQTMETGKFEQREIGEDETGQPYYGMAKLIGPRAKVRMWYANGVELRCHLDGDRGPGLGCIVVGEKGKIEVNRDKITSNPAALLTGDDRPKTLPELGHSETAPHVKNFIDCIKTRERANADIAYAHRSTTICNLINIVREVGLVGERLKWDPAAERFTNCDQANQNRWMTRPRRKGYELSAIG